MITDIKLQEQIRKEFELEFSKGLASKTSIMKYLASKHSKAYSTIHKIVSNGYRKTIFDEKRPLHAENILKPVKPNSRTLIFLGWEIRIKYSKEFLEIIDQIADYYSAEVYVTSLWPDDLKFIPTELTKYNLLMSDMRINKNLIFKYVPTHALVKSPLEGWSGAHDDSVIFPGLVKELITEKSPKLCKQLMTTGSVGELNAFLTDYRHVTEEASRNALIKRWSMVQNRRGGKQYEIAKTFTKPSALIIDVKDDNIFFSRYITMEKKGVVYDKNLKFSYKKPFQISSPSALVMGDLHANEVDPLAFDASKSMIAKYKPNVVVIQDGFNGSSISHHDIQDPAKMLYVESLDDEAATTKAVLKQIRDISKKVVWKQSNHCNFLTKYLLDEKNYRLHRNYLTAVKLRAWQIETQRHPIIKLLEMDSVKNLEFSSEKDSFIVSGVNIIHGHEGISGVKTGFRRNAQVYNKLVQGHTHEPAVFRNAVCVGTNSRLDLDYKMGPDAWMHANALIQPDGSIQLLNIIYGEYEL